MNLKEVLNYRNRCLICYSEMELKVLDLANITLHKVKDGLLIETGLKGIAVQFKYDGSYVKMKRWNNLYVKPMSLLKECPNCIPEIVIPRGRSHKGTSIDQLKDLRCAYTISLFGDSEGKFDANLDWEDIKYNDGERFYHIKTSFGDNESNLMSGSYKDDSLDTMLRLKVPAVKAGAIQTIDDLVKKIKLYTLFS